MSHDLRSPLRIIDGYAAIVAADFEPLLTAESKVALEQIRLACDRAGNLIDGLLEVAHIGRRDLVVESVDVNALVARLITDIEREPGSRKIEWIVHDLPGCVSDKVLITQVFANLLSNAHKFTSGRRQPRVEIGSISTAEIVGYFVRDNGVGFDMSFAGDLFEMFKRLPGASSFPGSGVGLPLARRAIERLGGNIWVESVEGEYACFYFTVR